VDWKQKQNPDGGWAYRKGNSWTEPTALVLMAQSVTRVDRESVDSGVRFLQSVAGPGGGYRPTSTVQESTWVTVFAALLPIPVLGARRYAEAIGWLKGQTGRESGWRYKLQQRMAGNRTDFPEGWPWFPGAAAWVIPTSLGILAFEHARSVGGGATLGERIDFGRDFLLARMCADGGWNHGSNQALGRDGDSYPETTGIALLALHGVGNTPRIEKAKAAARAHLRTCRTAEGTAWLRMGLAAHGEPQRAASDGNAPVCRTITDFALTAIASAERNPLLYPRFVSES